LPRETSSPASLPRVKMARSDLAQGLRTDPFFQRILQDEVTRPAEEVLEKEFEVHVAVEGRVLEFDENVDVASRAGFPPGRRAGEAGLSAAEFFFFFASGVR